MSELKRSVLSVSVIEKKGFYVPFQDVQVLINPTGYSSNKRVVLGFREDKLYRTKVQPMRAMTSNRVEKNKE